MKADKYKYTVRDIINNSILTTPDGVRAREKKLKIKPAYAFGKKYYTKQQAEKIISKDIDFKCYRNKIEAVNLYTLGASVNEIVLSCGLTPETVKEIISQFNKDGYFLAESKLNTML